MSISFEDYLTLASRTEKMLDPSPGSSTHPRMVHHSMGFATEMGELIDALKKHYIYGKPLDEVNVMEEIGDALWYVAGMANHAGLSPRDLQAQAVLPPVFASGFWAADVAMLVRASGHLQSAMAHYDIAPTPHTVAQCLSLLGAVMRRWAPNYTINQAMGVNIAKLQKRYPAGYSNDDALLRKLDAERAILEQKG